MTHLHFVGSSWISKSFGFSSEPRWDDNSGEHGTATYCPISHAYLVWNMSTEAEQQAGVKIKAWDVNR